MRDRVVLAVGTKVRTLYGFGTVEDCRVSADGGAEVYSVVLDHKRRDPRYCGTIIPAEHVTAVDGGDA